MNGVFKVEIGAWFVVRDHSCQGGLSTLARAKKGHDGMDAKGLVNAFQCMGTGNHRDILSLKIIMSSDDFQ